MCSGRGGGGRSVHRSLLALVALHAIAIAPALPAATAATGADLRLAIAATKPAEDAGALGKLDTTLRQLVAGQARAAEGRVSARAAGGEVEVSIGLASDGSEALERLVADAGGTILHRIAGLVEARLPVASLPSVARHAEVTVVRSVVAPWGGTASGAPAGGTGTVRDEVVQAPPGLDGAGVRVGIIDVGFEGYGALTGSDLPAPAAVRCYTGVGEHRSDPATCERPPALFLGSLPAHGTAVAEALLEVAPAVELYLANPPSPLDLHATVDWMIEQGVDVINYSMSRFYEGPGDGTSPLPGSAYGAIERATAAGVVWVGAAGNLARRHWRGAFSDLDGDGVHAFDEVDGGVEVNCLVAARGEWISGSLRWDDDWFAPGSDLDLALLQRDVPIAVSSDRQSGETGQIPLEALALEAPADGAYCFAIVRGDGPTPEWVELASFGHDLVRSTPVASIAAPADAGSPGALAVGATPWFDPSRIEPFSSWGPTSDGRLKPDLVSVNRRRAEVLGGEVFVGTSQSAPYVAGLVALARQALPSLDAVGVADLLVASAEIPPGESEQAWGHGLARLVGVGEDLPDATCDASTELCLGGGRFALAVEWTAPDGRRGTGVPRSLTGDSGLFTFFDPDNVELVVKVLDGCALNGRFWVFAGGLTDLGVELEVRDLVSGDGRTYRAPGGAPFSTLRDIDALGGCSLEGGATSAGERRLGDGWSEAVTLGSRFRVSMRWSRSGRSAPAVGQTLGADSAAFAFFDRDNVEVVLKVLDGRPVNGRWWVYASGLTDVGVEIRVEDLLQGVVRTWSSPEGTPFVPVTDVEAFR
ncbi:MAG TPA: S8 family serine peptidase [Thermoanaerobaculia bacterium]|nr:S8 family serine peptidase [Thermoanaerobaculia bacterium]